MTVNALPGHAEMREVAHLAFLLTSGVVLHENIETFTIKNWIKNVEISISQKIK